MARLLLVSNRLPVTVSLVDGQLDVSASSGGLATGLTGPHERSGGLWIGWPGDTSRFSSEQISELEARLTAMRAVPLYLSRKEIRAYYDGFSNGVLWPLFHYLLDRIPLQTNDWEAYRAVNQRFADRVVEHYQPGDLIWVQDYQLALVPGMLRRLLPEARIGFFLHIPFPAAEVFRIFPWREAVLEGLLGADLIGFHTLSYLRQFANSLLHTLGVPAAVDRLSYRGRVIRLGAFPMGIDAAAFATLGGDAEVVARAEQIRGQGGGSRIIVGIDRLDYTKGIPRRLLAIERLLEREPSLRGQLRYIQVAVPSRVHVEEYEALSQRVHQQVGRINGLYGTPNSVPIHYLYRSFEPRELAAMYRAAEVMLVTPLRDGMNLVAKEFVASRVDDQGVLVLSEFAGAASEMGEALVVNPYDADRVAATIARALTMSAGERRTRMRALRRRVTQYDVHRWAQEFIEALSQESEFTAPQSQRLTSRKELSALVQRLRGAERLTWLLDYDGTLVPFTGRPELAHPDDELKQLLLELTRRPNTSVHVVSGRPREVLELWLGELPLGLHAEHGLWSRRDPAGAWTLTREVPTEWRAKVRELLEQFVIRAPGAFIEEKSASIAWHYRMTDPEFGERQANELHLHLSHALSNVPVEVLTGDKVIEVQPHGVNKGLVVAPLLAETSGAQLVAIGDDQTDENLFAALPEDGVAIHVGPRPSRAAYRLPDVAGVLELLRAVLRA